MVSFVTGRFKRALKEGKTTFGIWITIASPDVTEALSRVGFDWFVMDMEHAPLGISEVEGLIRPMNGSNTSPLVRVAWNDPVLIKLALDTGAEGVLIPWVNSKEDAERAVRACRYPPDGVRGVGPRRASVYWLDETYTKRANEELAVVVQIETEKAIKNMRDILSVEGVDAFFVGPYDLSFSLGVPGEFESDTFKDAMAEIVEVMNETGKPGGIWADSAEDAVKRVRQGFKFVAISADILLLVKTAKAILEGIKAGI